MSSLPEIPFPASPTGNDMSLNDIVELNPDISIHNLSNGQTLIIREVIPYLSVTTTKTLTYEDALLSTSSTWITPTCTRATADRQSRRARKIDRHGRHYLSQRKQDRVYGSGVHHDRRPHDPRSFEVGTAPRPKTAPTGTFKCP
jgi:hypothetical protein